MPKRQPPLDPRLLRSVGTARLHVLRTVFMGIVEAVCAIATAWALATLGTDLLASRLMPQANLVPLGVLAASLTVRAVAVWWMQATGHRAATATIATLRSRVVAANAAAGPRARMDGSASTTALATAGLENLRPYLTGYVPQLALAATVTPLALAAIAWWDLLSAAVALIALPLIPVFMIIIGLMTEGASQRSLATMRSLWSQTLDLVEGLPTLRALGRAHGSEKIVADVGRRHKQSAMTTLAFAFLSSFALELIATLGVAIIAVSIGLRLVDGSMDLFPAIAILVLAADVYLPLRQVGAQFHASTDGLAALDAAFDLINAPAVPHGDIPAPNLRHAHIEFTNLTVAGRDYPAPANFTATIKPGTITALRGGSGAGKSTALAAFLALLTPTQGSVSLRVPGENPVPVLECEPASLWSQITWLPQRPAIGPGTIREILLEALPDGATPSSHWHVVEDAARATGLIEHVINVHGWDAPIGRDGTGLSVGQRQRVALTRALINPKPLVVLDEPTSHLDGASEAMIIALITRLNAEGSTVLLSAHRDALLASAHQVIDVPRAHTHTDSEGQTPQHTPQPAPPPRTAREVNA